MRRLSYKIPPFLPFPKGGKYPSLAKRGEGRFCDPYQFIFGTLSISSQSNGSSAKRR